MLPSEALNNKEVMKTVMTFDFRNGGRFIVSDCLSVFHIVKITILLAALVIFGERKELEKEMQKYDIIPQLLLDVAKGARIGKGYRLLKQCVQHTMDPSAPSLQSASGMIFEHGDKVGICTEHDIKASMKEKMYQNVCAFTKIGVVCCSCDCPLGAKTESGE